MDGEIHVSPREKPKDKIEINLWRYLIYKNRSTHCFLELLKYLF